VLFAVLALASCTSKPSDQAMRHVFDQMPTPKAGWDSTHESSRCAKDASSELPMPPYIVAEARGGDDSYLDVAEDALKASGFAVHRPFERTSNGDIWAERGSGRSRISVQVFSGPGRNPEGAPQPASTVLRMTRDTGWCA